MHNRCYVYRHMLYSDTHCFCVYVGIGNGYRSRGTWLELHHKGSSKRRCLLRLVRLLSIGEYEIVTEILIKNVIRQRAKEFESKLIEAYGRCGIEPEGTLTNLNE